MPAGIYTVTLTGLSSSSGYPVFFPDIRQTAPFSVSIACVTASSSSGFSVQYSLDYPGPNSSGLTGAWNSTSATWFNSTGISGASSTLLTNYNMPVTAIRLNSTGGSSTNTVTMTIVQNG